MKTVQEQVQDEQVALAVHGLVEAADDVASALEAASHGLADNCPVAITAAQAREFAARLRIGAM